MGRPARGLLVALCLGGAVPAARGDAPPDPAAPAGVQASGMPVHAEASAASPASASAPPDSGRWGPLPAAADSVTAAFTTRADPWWFYPVRVPYYVVVWPLGVVFDGFGLLVVALDDAGVTERIARLLDPPSTRFRVGASVTLSGLEGFGGGIKVTDTRFFAEGNRAELNVATTTGGKSKLTLGTGFALTDDDRLQLGAGYRRRSRARYFGIGPGDFQAPVSYYKQTTGWAGGAYTRSLGSRVTGGIRLLFTSVRAEEPRRDDAARSISAVYPGDVADPGFGFNRDTQGLGAGVSLLYDSTTETGRPQGGGRYVAAGERFDPTDGWSPATWSAHVSLERFLRLWAPYRVLALRGVWGGITARSGEIPFQRLFVNDAGDELRGYRSFRWRDRNLATLSTELRWPIWSGERLDGPGLDALLLADAGQVFDDLDQVALPNVATSAGFGFRFIGSGTFLARFEVAFSRDETEFQFTFDQVFHQDRDGLLHGRNPVPLR